MEICDQLASHPAYRHVSKSTVLSEVAARFLAVPATIETSISKNVDMSLVQHMGTSIVESDGIEFREDSGDHDSVVKKSNRSEMMEQSIVVSKVAMKLEEFSKKASNLRAGPRTRRGGSGVVTPPFANSSVNFSHGLITYDDEPWYDNEDYKFGGFVPFASPCVASLHEVSDSGSSYNSSGRRYSKVVTITKPVADPATVDLIVQRILLSDNNYNRSPIIASANVAGFCMSNHPHAGNDISGKILHLLASCKPVATEFHLYRSALHPSEPVDRMPSTLFTNAYSGRKPDLPSLLYPNWKGEGCLSDLVREFTTFAINCLQKLLGKHDSVIIGHQSRLSPCDHKVLERTAAIWQRSVGTNVLFQ